MERWILARLRDRTFFSLAELNQAIRGLLVELNERPMKHQGQSRCDLFLELDRPALKPLPTQVYEFARWKKARVHINYHVEFDKHYYSVPHGLRGKEVDVRATEKTVEVYCLLPTAGLSSSRAQSRSLLDPARAYVAGAARLYRAL